VEDDAVGADRVSHPQRVRQRGQRLLPDHRVVGGRVDQVHGVDHDRLDRPVGHALAELVDVRLLVLRRPPHARRLVEDLDRVAAELDPALVSLDQAARGRHMAAD
jgi:hypothetical protein